MIVALSGSALADDKAACVDGIAKVKAALAERAAQTASAKATRALRIAEREQGEGEFDECLEALEDAQRALEK